MLYQQVQLNRSFNAITFCRHRLDKKNVNVKNNKKVLELACRYLDGYELHV